MKSLMTFLFLIVGSLYCYTSFAQTAHTASLTGSSMAPVNTRATYLFIDVHHLGAGKVTYADVANAHIKDLAVEKKYGVQFLNYWVDQVNGIVYCLSSSADSQSIRKTHAEAHGLLPDEIYQVTDGLKSPVNGNRNYFLDVHELGAGKVTAKDVAEAHRKDLAVENKYSVNFINYWVDEKQGVVMCLSQAPDSTAVINTHREAHGLLPAYIVQVKPDK